MGDLKIPLEFDSLPAELVFWKHENRLIAVEADGLVPAPLLAEVRGETKQQMVLRGFDSDPETDTETAGDNFPPPLEVMDVEEVTDAFVLESLNLLKSNVSSEIECNCRITAVELACGFEKVITDKNSALRTDLSLLRVEQVILELKESLEAGRDLYQPEINAALLRLVKAFGPCIIFPRKNPIEFLPLIGWVPPEPELAYLAKPIAASNVGARHKADNPFGKFWDQLYQIARHCSQDIMWSFGRHPSTEDDLEHISMIERLRAGEVIRGTGLNSKYFIRAGNDDTIRFGVDLPRAYLLIQVMSGDASPFVLYDFKNYPAHYFIQRSPYARIDTSLFESTSYFIESEELMASYHPFIKPLNKSGGKFIGRVCVGNRDKLLIDDFRKNHVAVSDPEVLKNMLVLGVRDLWHGYHVLNKNQMHNKYSDLFINAGEAAFRLVLHGREEVKAFVREHGDSDVDVSDFDR